MRVTAPNRQYNGNYGRDVFVNGVCEDASERHRAYYLKAGYDVDGEKTKAAKPKKTPTTAPVVEEKGETNQSAAVAAPPRSASADEWREFAESINLSVPEGARRSEIIAAYEAAQATV